MSWLDIVTVDESIDNSGHKKANNTKILENLSLLHNRL